MNCEFAQSTVHGYFDGELDAVGSKEFERHLETCPECKAQLRAMESLRSKLQESDLFEHASPRLRDRIRKHMAKEANGRRWLWSSGEQLLMIPALSAVVAAAASLVIVFLIFQSHAQSTRTTAELIDAHSRSLQPGHLMDVQSTDQHTVKPWFDGKLDFIPPVSNFSQQGFPLVGGRLDIFEGHNVAALVYFRRTHVINLFVWPYRKTETNFAGSGSHQGYNWSRWKSGDMEFCLVSDVSAADLRQLKDLIHE